VLGCLLYAGVLEEEVKKLNVEIELLHKPAGLDFSLPFRLAKVLKRRNISLIHTHNTGAYLYGAIAAKLAKVPVIIHTEHGRDFPDKRRLMLAERILSLWTSKIIAVSHDLKNSLVECENISPGKIIVIPNGIDLDLFQDYSQEIVNKKRSEMGLNPDDFIIGNIARLAPIKDHKHLIKAFKIVLREVHNAKLIIVGNGPLREELFDYSNNLGLSKKIFFLGERKDIPELLATLDVFVLSSQNEGISLTLLEAMAAKRPVVATTVGGNKEIVEDGITGYLVPPENSEKLAKAIVNVAANSKAALQMGIFARERVRQKYSLEKMVERYREVYEKCLAERGVDG